MRDFDSLQAIEGEQLRDLRRKCRTVMLQDDHRIVEPDRTVENPSDGDSTEVVTRVEIGNEHLQRRLGISPRRRHVVHDRLEEGAQVVSHAPWFGHRHTFPRVGVEHGKLDLVLGSVEIDEEVVNLVQHFLRAGVWPVDLVEHDDRRQPAFERLAQDEARLRQWALRGVDQQHDAVDHRQRTLHLSTEIGVAWGIDDVDEVVLKVHRGVLGQNRDAALALQIGVVHHPFGHLLIGPERAALPEQRIDQGGLAMVDVRDDREITAERVGDLARLLL